MAPLSLWVKVFYGAGEICNAIKVVALGLYGVFFATTVMGVSGTWIGVIGFVTVLWDALIDPFVGYLSDGGGWSRRIRFMTPGALVMGLGFWAFFAPPANLASGALFAWLIVASLVMRTASSMYIVPYYGLGARLSDDYNERTSITAIRGAMSAIGTLLTAAVSLVVFFPDKIPGVDPKLHKEGYFTMGLSFGVVMTVVALMALVATLPLRDRIAAQGAEQAPNPADFFRGMFATARNRSFRILLIGSFCVVLAFTITGALGLYFMTYYVGVSGSKALSATQVAFFAGGLAGTLLWANVAKYFDKKTLCVSSAILTGLVLASGWFLFGEGHVLGAHADLSFVLIGTALTGLVSSVLWFMPQSMIADIADEYEFDTGSRRDGALFGMFSLVQQIAAGVALLLSGLLLDHVIGIAPGEQVQTALTVSRMGLVYGLAPAGLLSIAAIVIASYRLDRTRVESIQEGLRRRREVGDQPAVASV